MVKFPVVACVCTTCLGYLEEIGLWWSVWTEDAHGGGVRYGRLECAIWG
jgi:hypothetical protein